MKESDVVRPRVPLLSRSRIADAAVELAERRGDFTVQDLARELRVHPSSLYHHISGRDEVVDLIRQRMADEIDPSGFGVEPWDDALDRFARSYRQAFARRINAIRLLFTSPVGDQIALSAYESMAQALLAAGFDERDIIPVIQAIESFLIGSALDLEAEDDMIHPGEAHPALNLSVEADRSHRTGPRADRVFDIGLEAMLAGLRLRLSHSAPGADDDPNGTCM